jgi:hypothetical protein
MSNWPYQSYEDFNNPSQPMNISDNNNLHFQQQQTGTTEYDYNAKIYFKENETVPQYELYSGSNKPSECHGDGLRGTLLDETILSKQFFSKQNIDIIQEGIIEKIYSESGNQYRISRQSDMQLQIIMRSIYLKYAKNATDILLSTQVNALNQKTINSAAETILPNILQYIGYRRDIGKPREIMPNSIIITNKGNKTASFADRNSIF